MNQTDRTTVLSDNSLILISEIVPNKKTNQGIFIAGTIILLWAISLSISLSVNLSNLHPFWIFILVLWQTFLNTGLFITAHDAIHGVVYPQNLKINHAIGSLAVTLYAFLPYQELTKKHWQHHRYPASELDPDYHDGDRDDFFHWYIYFMKGYWQVKRFFYLVITYSLITCTLHISLVNSLLFLFIPPLLSSLQLFYFGTFLTHREPKNSYTNRHRTISSNFSTFWSFLSCYHFGYHLEHHEYPHLPWWQLPTVRNHSGEC